MSDPYYPSLERTYRSTVEALKVASSDKEFGARLLISGKSKALRGKRREAWLTDHIAKSLDESGLSVSVDHLYGGAGRIDIALLGEHGDLAGLIEVKFLFAHQRGVTMERHPYLLNVYWDLIKRADLDCPKQAIVLVGDYIEMPESGKRDSLYQAEAIRRVLAARGATGFEAIQSDFVEAFSSTCDLYPRPGDVPAPNECWQAAFAGAAMNLRAWVFGLRPGVDKSTLLEEFRELASAREYERRMEKLES